LGAAANIAPFPSSRRRSSSSATTDPQLLSLANALASGTALTELPARLQAIAATLGSMLSEGYSKAEIARYFAKSRPWVSARLLELEAGLRQHGERLPGSSGGELSELDSRRRRRR
jgi:hypothetical protein